MATERQKKAISNVVENGGNVSKSMKQAGYAEATAKNPKKLTDSKGWEELMEEHLPDKSLGKLHKKFLKKEEVIVRNNNETKELESVFTKQPHPDALKALDLAYKLKDKYAKEEKTIILKNYEPDQIKRVAREIADVGTGGEE